MSSKAKSGRPTHAVWKHFIKGEKRTAFHHHAYCKYCSEAQAQAGGPKSIEAIRGVPKNMLRHLSMCMHCPATTRAEIRVMAREHGSNSSKKRKRVEEEVPSPLLELLLGNSDVGSNDSSTLSTDKRTITESPDRIYAKIGVLGKMPWNWAWNAEVMKLVSCPAPSPSQLLKLCKELKLPNAPEMPWATLSIVAWTTVCTREHTLAFTLIHPESSRTISIVSLDDVIDISKYIAQLISSCPPLVAIVVDSILLLEATRIAAPHIAILFCTKGLLRLLSSFVFEPGTLSSLTPYTWQCYATSCATESASPELWQVLTKAWKFISSRTYTCRDNFVLYAMLAKHEKLYDGLQKIISKFDTRLLLLAYALHTSTNLNNLTLFKGLHWITIGAWIRHFCQQWQLPPDQVLSEVIEMKKENFPFDQATKALYAEDATSFYAFLSESHPNLYAFCSRLYGISPSCASYDKSLNGLADIQINPGMARIDIPISVLLSIVQNHETTFQDYADTKSNPIPQDWSLIERDIESFAQSEVNSCLRLPNANFVINWQLVAEKMVPISLP